MTIIMLKIVPLIFKRIERFILDSPPRAPGTHDVVNIFF